MLITEGFVSLLNKIEQKFGEPIPQKAKMLELNKARVNFKHYGNLPASSESEKLRIYAYGFLTLACHRYLETNFDEVSLAALIGSTTIRRHIEAAQEALAKGDIQNAVSEAALGRFFMFKKLDIYFPKIDQELREADRLFEQIPEISGYNVKVFHYLTEYIEGVTRFNAASICWRRY